jgi:arsenite oxidase small subunit
MERRQFLRVCTMVAGAAQLGSLGDAWASAEPRLYGRSKLVDVHGAPIRLADLALKTNYVFNYPYAGTPCFLLNLGRPVAAADTVLRADGASYAWTGGVGPAHSVVSYSAICAHKLAYPTRDVSFIRYQKSRSATSSGRVIHCCADHSVYDPTAGARVVAGPAPQPLASIALAYDAGRDEVAAIGTIGAEQFAPFFEKYAFKLELEYGGIDRARKAIEATTVLRELTNYCRTTIEC